jgi:DHA2 family multidrug resistance protein-like MFS transporter
VYRGRLGDALPATIPTQVADAVRDTLASALTATSVLPDPLAIALQAAARDAFVSGMHAVAGVTLVLFVVIALVELSMLRHIRPIGAPAKQDEPAPEGAGTACAVYAA